MNTKNKIISLLFFFLSISICGIAQNTFENSKVTAEQIIGKYIKYVTINNTTVIEIDTVAIKNLLKEEIKPVIDAFDEFISEQKLMRKQFTQQDSIKNDSIMRLNERIQISEKSMRYI